jgi:hypothetical protein
MLTFAVEQWIGNAAAVLSGAWGAVTRRSEQSGYSHGHHTHAERVVQAVASEQASGIGYETLWEERGGCGPKMRPFGEPGLKPRASARPTT